MCGCVCECMCVYARARACTSRCVWLYGHVSHASRDDSVLRAFRGKQWADPSPGCAPGKHRTAAKLMSIPLMRFRRASSGQQIYDGARRSVIPVNWSCGREMLTKSSQRKRLSARNDSTDRRGAFGMAVHAGISAE